MTSQKNRILVVGATGTVGSLLVRLLVDAGERVNAATRDPDPDRDLGPSVNAVRYDFDDPSTFDDALDGVDRVFYLTRPADAQAAVVAKPLFDKAAALGVTHIVNMSALGTEADDSIPLRQVEILLEQSGIPYSLLRPNWFMQNFTTGDYGDMIRAHHGLFLPAAQATVSLVDARDIAAVAAKLLIDGGPTQQTYALTGPEALSLSEVAMRISGVSGGSITYLPISDEDLTAALGAQRMPDFVVAFMLGLFGRMRAGHNGQVSTDVGSILGHPPRSFSAFTTESAASFIMPATSV